MGKSKNKVISKIFLLTLALVTIFLLYLLVKNQMIEIIRLAKSNDQAGLKDFIQDLGIWGKIIIIIIEGIQMVVVVIPAEFVQLSAAVSFPLWLAFLLCEAGVFFGASMIYGLVNILKFDSEVFTNANAKIKAMELKQKKSNSVVALMYLLFIMPIIPFGAICYYGSNKKIGYWRYILTCITGVIPSILTSNLMGNAILLFLKERFPIWLLILIIIGLAAILFIGVFLVMKKFFLKNEKGTPNSFTYNFFYKVFRLYTLKDKVHFKNQDKMEINEPSIILVNHLSFLDFYYIARFFYPYKLTYVVNKYYFRIPFVRHWIGKMNAIGKMLFYPDISTIKKIMSGVKNKNMIVLFPEGRLSVDGKNYEMVENTSALIKKLGVPLKVINIHGTYLEHAKWSKVKNKGFIEIEYKDGLNPEQLKEMSLEEISHFINENIQTNEFDYALTHSLHFKGKRKLEGLEDVIYTCPQCKKEYTLKTKGNTIYCEDCGMELSLDTSFHFYPNGLNIRTIAQLHDRQKEMELASDLHEPLQEKVIVKKLHATQKKLDVTGEGMCTLKGNVLHFSGKIQEEVVDFEVTLIALAFSCHEEFECYYKNELYYFYPQDNIKCLPKWALRVDVYNEVCSNEKAESH